MSNASITTHSQQGAFCSASDFASDFISEEALANTPLGGSKRTWQRRRRSRAAPPYVRVGRRVFYRVAAVRDWLLKQECHDSAISRAVQRPRATNRFVRMETRA
jgi:hypothetical protein